MLTESSTVSARTLLLLFLIIQTSAQSDRSNSSVVPAVMIPVLFLFMVLTCTCFCICIWRGNSNQQNRIVHCGPGRFPNVIIPARSNDSTTSSNTPRSDTATVLPHSATITTAEGVSMNVLLPQMNHEQQEVILEQQGHAIQLSDQPQLEQEHVWPSAPPLNAELSSQVPPPSYDAAVAYQTYTPEQVVQNSTEEHRSMEDMESK